MANVKITDLNAYTDPASTDVLPIVDVVTDETKKVSIADLMENAGTGSEVAPSIAFDGDANTGIYRPGADQIAISTGGTKRLEISATGAVTIPGNLTAAAFIPSGSSVPTNGVYLPSSNNVAISTNSTGRLFIDSSGRLGVGTSSPESRLHSTKPSSSYQPIATFSSQDGTVKLRVDDVSNSSSTNRVYITHNFSRPGGTFTADSASVGVAAIKFDNGTIAFATDAAGDNDPANALYIDSSQRVGIGTTNPSQLLHLNSATAASTYTLYQNPNTQTYIGANPAGDTIIYNDTAGRSVAFSTAATERARIDSSGRLLVGTSSASSYYIGGGAHTPKVQVIGTDVSPLSVERTNGAPHVFLATGQSPASGGEVAKISFNANDGANKVQAALISAFIDGTPGANDMPGRLVFSTTADGSGTPTERMRIDSSGRVGIGTSTISDKLEIRNGAAVVGFSDNTTRTNKLFAGFGYETGGTLYGNCSIRSDYNSTTNSSTLNFHTAAGAGADTERVRIDASGRLLVGTSTARSDFFNGTYTPQFQLASAGNGEKSSIALVSAGNGAYNEPNLIIAKSRGNAIGDDTAVQSGDFIGAIQFQGSDGAEFVGAASITALVDGTPGANDMPGRIVFSTTADGASTPTERMRIQSDGNIRLTSSNAGINNATATINVYESGGSRAGFFGFSSGGAVLLHDSGNTNPIRFFQNGAEAARIDASGRLLVGTSSTSSEATVLLQGNNNGSTLDGTLRFARGTSSPTADSSLGKLDFGDSGHTTAARIQCLRDGGTWTSGSSQPTKLTFATTANGASSPTQRMGIYSTGEIYINRTTRDPVVGSDCKFQLECTGAEWAAVIRNSNANPYGLRLVHTTDKNNTSNVFLQCLGSSTQRAAIRTNGGLANYQSNNVDLSDERTKRDISSVSSTWDCVQAWDVVNYNYLDDAVDDTARIGVIAQQVQQHCPEVVIPYQEAEDAVLDDDGNVVIPAKEERLGVREQQMMWMAIKALQEAQTRIETLEAEVAALKGA